MSYREQDIIREGKRHTIIKRGVGRYEMLRHGVTAATVCGWFTFPNDDTRALAYANRDFDRREA